MSAMTDFLNKARITQVQTEKSGVLQLRDCIGEGGQGAVFLTQQRNRLVKICCTKKESEKEVKNVYRRYNSLRCMENLPSEMALPLCEFEPIEVGEVIVYGYVMELMEDMVSLGSLFRKNNERPDAYIKRMGGIRRMYIILRKLAEILDGIHSAGYCYGDLNPNNVFVSSDVSHNVVQLIDCDNLMIAADYKGTIYYPGYGAPEIMKGLSCNSSITDSWSFAVLAFYTFRQVLPFAGKMVTDAGTMEFTQMQRKAESAELPFVDEGGDNFAASALPRDIMETAAMQELFKKAFAKDSTPASRPILREWIEALKAGESWFVKCASNSCGNLFLWKKNIQCPFCDGTSVKPYAAIRVKMQQGTICHSLGNPAMIADVPVMIDLPVSEYKMCTLEVSLDAVAKKLNVKLKVSENQKNENPLKIVRSIGGVRAGKAVALAPDVSMVFPVKSGELYYFQLPEYKSSLIGGNATKSIFVVKCRGLDD